jgi:hypothetical protein
MGREISIECFNMDIRQLTQVVVARRHVSKVNYFGSLVATIQGFAVSLVALSWGGNTRRRVFSSITGFATSLQKHTISGTQFLAMQGRKIGYHCTKMAKTLKL